VKSQECDDATRKAINEHPHSDIVAAPKAWRTVRKSIKER
jgi:hypothetical protein